MGGSLQDGLRAGPEESNPIRKIPSRSTDTDVSSL
jgi:hypothetical protein